MLSALADFSLAHFVKKPAVVSGCGTDDREARTPSSLCLCRNTESRRRASCDIIRGTRGESKGTKTGMFSVKLDVKYWFVEVSYKIHCLLRKQRFIWKKNNTNPISGHKQGVKFMEMERIFSITHHNKGTNRQRSIFIYFAASQGAPRWGL